MATINELRQKQGEMVAEMRAIAERADKGTAKADDTARFDELSASVDAIKNEIETLLAIDSMFLKAAPRRSAFAGNRDVMGTEVREAFASLRDGMASGTPGRVEIARRAFLANPSEHSVRPQFVTGDYANATPQILSLFPTESANGPTVRVYRVSNAASAGNVAEGAVKPDAGLAFDSIDVAMQKIANKQKVSTEFMADAATFYQQVPAELMRAVVVQENAYAYSVFSGASGMQAVSATNVTDGVADAVSSLFVNAGVEAEAIVMNPSDLAVARKATATGSGQYVYDPVSAAPGTLHGLPYVVSNAVPSGTVFVGAFSTAGIAYVRDAMTVQAGYTQDDWEKNLVTLIAEERVALGMTRPGHVAKITVSAG